jgi:cysteine-rich repeat protein
MRTPLARVVACPRPVVLLPVVLSAALALGGSRAAQAHSQSYPIEGDDVRVRTDLGPGSTAFTFSSLDGAGIFVGHDPTADGAALLVRGLGANGGRTPLVTLDPANWSALAGGGFAYDDPSGARGGVTDVLFRNGELSITATRDGWGWAPAGAQSEVWVHFRVDEEWYCAQFPAAAASVNTTDHFAAAGAAAPGACPEAVCGNGVRELGEECDDGDLEEGDGCDPDCTVGECNAASFDTTFEGLQSVVFESEAYGCTNVACHDSVLPAGDLDLTTDHAYQDLLGEDGRGAPSSSGLFKRVLPTEPNESLLYLKLASKKAGYDGPNVGSPMPTGFPALGDDHLEAVRQWIRGGAPSDRVVEGTAELLGTCLPPSDPLKTPPLAPPPLADGFQLQQTPRPLLGIGSGQGEDEICMATWFDLSARLPATAAVPCPEAFLPRSACSHDPNQLCTVDAECGVGNTCDPAKNTTNPDGTCFAYDRLTLSQDPQSHHSILGVYTGFADTSHQDWGPWTYKFEPDDPRSAQNGEPCDPLDIDPALGFNPGCSSEMKDSIACVGYGPPDLGNLNLIAGGGGGNLPQVLISQETYYDYRYAPGVYNVMPTRGIMVWNSHAFNLTQTDSTLAQYLNVEYAPEPERQHESLELFDATWIFAQFVPPFEQREVCATSTLPRGTRLFQLSSHTHRHGVRWRTWGPPNAPCQPRCPSFEDDPFLGLLEQFGLCVEDPNVPYCEPRDDQPMYFSTDYSDPLNLQLEPPLELDSKYAKDRTFLYCALFDNGATPQSPPVKQQSTSPYPPSLFGFPPTLLEVLGGPCPWQTVACLNDGPMKGQKCGTLQGADHELCDSSPGAGDGVCDACPVHGGVTTEDEMFILLGNYYQVPEPQASWLSLAAAASLAALSRRRATSRREGGRA